MDLTLLDTNIFFLLTSLPVTSVENLLLFSMIRTVGFLMNVIGVSCGTMLLGMKLGLASIFRKMRLWESMDELKHKICRIYDYDCALRT